jgi:hypothetical protein
VASSIWKRTRRSSPVSLLALLSVSVSAQTPILTLDKHQFFPNESVRFWIGVSSLGPIPEAVRESGVVHIVRPDGSKVDQAVHSPIDGDPSREYKGGWGLGEGPNLPGKYHLSFEYAGKKTEDQTLEIVPNPLEGLVQAYWVFDVKSHNAILRVENHTDRIVRFAEPGLMGSELSISVRQDHPLSMAHQFVPESAVSPPHITPGYSFDSLDWSNLSCWPIATVPPGQAVERTVALDAAFSFRYGQEYDVKLGWVMTLFVGESGDPEAHLFPERRVVTGDSRFSWNH